MTNEEFCSIYSAYYGEKLSHVEQLKREVLTGEELKDIIDFFIQELSKLHQPTVIKNEVAVCPECGCNKVQKIAGDNYSCMNAYCEWQTVL